MLLSCVPNHIYIINHYMLYIYGLWHEQSRQNEKKERINLSIYDQSNHINSLFHYSYNQLSSNSTSTLVLHHPQIRLRHRTVPLQLCEDDRSKAFSSHSCKKTFCGRTSNHWSSNPQNSTQSIMCLLLKKVGSGLHVVQVQFSKFW